LRAAKNTLALSTFNMCGSLGLEGLEMGNAARWITTGTALGGQ
jgi:hypothetical protein